MSNAHLFEKVPAGVHEALWQMFKDAPIWDGNLVCKTSRKWLVNHGMAAQAHGFNFLTAGGVGMAVSIGMDRKKEAGK